MRLIFMGTPDFAAIALKALIGSSHEIVAVYSQPPRPAGRGKKLQPSPVHKLAVAHDIPVFTPLNFKDQTDRDTFSSFKADAAIVAAYGLILPQAILDAPRLGCLNIHASLLPRWRGAAPIHRAIEAGDTKTGVGIMQMERGLDTGPVLHQVETEISADMTTGKLHDILADIGATALLETLERMTEGRFQAKPQSLNGITYAHKIEKAEAQINWAEDVDIIDRHIRAMNPFPGAYTEGPVGRLKILAGSIQRDILSSAAAGTLLSDKGLVACGAGAYQIERLQKAGKGAQDIEEFLRGNAIGAGSVFALPGSETES